MYITLIVLLLAVIFFVSGKIRSDVVAVCALLILMVFDILTPAEALSGFSSSIVIMMIGLFVVGGAIFQTGLAKVISGKIMNLAGNNENLLFVLVILVTASIGAFVSNTGTVALMMPIVVSLAMSAKLSPSRFLMPLAFASSMGGMMTLIGTPPNLVISETLVDNGFKGMSFFGFFPIGIICVIVGTLVLWPLCKIFLSKGDHNEHDKKKGKSLKDLAHEYQLAQNLFRLRAIEDCSLIGQKLQDSDLGRKYDIHVLEIRRRSYSGKPFMKTINQKMVGPETLIEENDILYIMGDFEQTKRFATDCGLNLVDSHQIEVDNPPAFAGKLRFDEIGIAELVLLSHAALVGHPVKDSGFREKYKVNILGIQRGKKYILQNLKDEKMHSGDVLLVQGEWVNIARLTADSQEWVVMGQPMEEASKLTLDHKAPVAATIMLAMIVALVTNVVPAVTAVMLAAILAVLTGCFRNVEDAYKTINWQSIVLIGGMLPMSVALEKTGTAALVSGGLVSGLGDFGPWALLAGIYFATSLLTMFISNTATAVLFAPIAIHAALKIGASPYPFLLAVAVAASMCFASPFATPPNALVMSAGRYTFMDYVKVGLPLQLILGIIMIFALPLIFPF